jgi:hypothetical protein
LQNGTLLQPAIRLKQPQQLFALMGLSLRARIRFNFGHVPFLFPTDTLPSVQLQICDADQLNTALHFSDEDDDVGDASSWTTASDLDDSDAGSDG